MPATYHASLIAGPYIFRHKLVTLETSHTKPKPNPERKTKQKFTDDTITQFKSEFNNMPILESTTLNMAANQLNNEILKTIENISLATTKTITSRHKTPWYDEDQKNQRKTMKNRKEMNQIQRGPTLEGIQKGTKQICCHAQIQKA